MAYDEYLVERIRPGILFLFLGISVLALEIEWARELHKKGLQGLEKVFVALKSRFRGRGH